MSTCKITGADDEPLCSCGFPAEGEVMPCRLVAAAENVDWDDQRDQVHDDASKEHPCGLRLGHLKSEAKQVEASIEECTGDKKSDDVEHWVSPEEIELSVSLSHDFLVACEALSDPNRHDRRGR